MKTINEISISSAEGSAHPAESPKRQPRAYLWVSVAAVVGLIALNFACFYRSLNGYFLADDYGHIPWLYSVFHGHPELLLKNFTSNWMQTEGTQFYRPLISLTLAADFAVWGVNAFGYHLSNLLFQTGSSIFLFLAARRTFELNPSNKGLIATTGAFVCAALFAVFPLHPEVVSWIIGRVDSVATMFYLAAFWLFLRARSKGTGTTYAVSLLCFGLSLLSKEIAVSLPPSLVVLAMLFPEGTQTEAPKLKARIAHSLKETLPYWLLLAGYIVVRTAALGTITGGYTGSVGAGLSGSILHRLLDEQSFNRVLFPLNAELFGHGDKMRRFLRIVYEMLAVCVVSRMVLSVRCRKLNQYLVYPAFAVIWFLLVMAPAYQVWGIAPLLQGSRYIYLGSAPLCLLAASLLLPMAAQSETGRLLRTARTICNTMCAAVSILLIVCASIILVKNNSAWTTAADDVRALKVALIRKLGELPPNKDVVLLNLPQQYAGAHMLYNASMLGVLLQPPLSDKDYSKRVATLEPIMFGDSELIDFAQLKRLASSGRFAPVYWDADRQSLKPLRISQSRSIESKDAAHPPVISTAASNAAHPPVISTAASNAAHLPVISTAASNAAHPPVISTAASESVAGTQVRLNESNTVDFSHPLVAENLDLPATAFDFVSFDVSTLKSSKHETPGVIAFRWSGHDMDPNDTKHQLVVPLDPAKATQSVRLCLSQHKTWVSSESIDRIEILSLTPGCTVRISNCQLLSGEAMIPQLAPATAVRGQRMVEENNGVIWTRSEIGPLSYDVSRIKGATGAMYELSRRNCWFDHYSECLVDAALSPVVSERGSLPGTRGETAIKPTTVKESGFYSLRIFATDKANKPIEYSSFPLNLWIEEKKQ